MRVSAQSGDDKADSESLATAQRSGDLPVPFRNLEGVEGIAAGFRVDMFDLDDGAGHGGSMATGSGFGSDYIIMDWTDKNGVSHHGLVRGLDILRAWVATFAPEDVEAFPDGLK
jgi:hypothetical protein